MTVELLPDTELAAVVEKREKDRLQAAKAGMSTAQIEAVIRETEELKLRQVHCGCNKSSATNRVGIIILICAACTRRAGLPLHSSLRLQMAVYQITAVCSSYES